MNSEGIAFWLFWLILFVLVLNKKGINKITVSQIDKQAKVYICIFLLVFALICLVPMSFVPCFNGKDPGHRDQYEKITESFIHGHMFFDYETDPVLETLDNPYDPAARIEAGADFHWDHAYYNGRYYMYFGVVPVVLLFVPFRLLTGIALLSYHAAQIFIFLFIIAFFLFAYRFLLKYRPDFNLTLYLWLTAGLCLASVNNCVESPALYNTAISAGMCFAMWSIYLYFKALIFDETIKFRCLLVASLSGALVFGCRPNIGLFVIILIPVLSLIINKSKEENMDKNFTIKALLTIFIPYLIIGILLMVYNYLRFDSIFEFGQSYQLTDTDQHLFNNIFDNFDHEKFFACLYNEFFMITKSLLGFNLPGPGGLLTTFPVMWPFVFVLIYNFLRKKDHEETYNIQKSRPLITGLAVSMFLIIFADILMSPYPLTDRYKGDVYFIFAIIYIYLIVKNYDIIDHFMNVFKILSVLTFFVCFLLYLTSESLLWLYYPDIVDNIRNNVFFGIF